MEQTVVHQPLMTGRGIPAPRYVHSVTALFTVRRLEAFPNTSSTTFTISGMEQILVVTGGSLDGVRHFANLILDSTRVIHNHVDECPSCVIACYALQLIGFP